MTDHPAPNPNQPDALVEKARAEAEKRLPDVKVRLVGDYASNDKRAELRRAFVEGARWAAAAVLPEVERHANEVTGDTSDGYHTFNELYAYRRAYNAALFNEWAQGRYPVVKSWRHSDGELAFGGSWFIVVATLPTGQVSNHYEAEHWDQFQVPEVDLPPEYDGHTPAEALNRLVALYEPEG